MTTPSDTPRTDAATIEVRLDHPLIKSIVYVTTDFARQLERELNAQTASHAVTAGHCDDVIRERDALKSEVEELRKDNSKFVWKAATLMGALSTIAAYDEEPIWDDDRDDAADQMLDVARQAIDAAMKGNQ